MTSSKPKLVLSRSQDIPFNKLVLSQSNVRRVKGGLSIEQLAEDIAHRGLLQSLNVRPVLDAQGIETGMFEIPAGGRRYRALELLIKQKCMAKTTLVPCVMRERGNTTAEEDSLAENVQRINLHPLDQFRAFQTLRNQGLGDDEIAARFFTTPAVVKQRLRLAAVSEKLLDIYAGDGMTLEQLMAFTVSDDHARQEQVWETISSGFNKEPYAIRRLLTEGAVNAGDKRAQFVGVDAYLAAGGIITHDLFEEDDGGWLQDSALLNRLVTEKLKIEAGKLADEGWKWITVATDFPYGHTDRLGRLSGESIQMTTEEQSAYDALKDEFDRLEEKYAQADEFPDDVDQRLGEIETALARFDDRPVRYDPACIARAGVFVSIDSDGNLLIERGYVRPEDEISADGETGEDDPQDQRDGAVMRTKITIGGEPDCETAEEDEGIRPLSDRLVTELTAHRTLALRNALANAPDIAFVSVLHVLCLNAFYHYGIDTCLEITARSAGFTHQAPGLNESASAKAIMERHESWSRQLPERPADLWNALLAFDSDSRMALFAHCAAITVNIVKEPHQRRPGALIHGEILARAVNLDMAAAGWRATVDNYLSRVPKTRILEAVREAKGEASVQLIDHLKKPEMAKEAERLLDGTGWLPEPLRTLEPAVESEVEGETLPEFLSEEEARSEPQSIAAE